jgi:hypothetical protein
MSFFLGGGGGWGGGLSSPEGKSTNVGVGGSRGEGDISFHQEFAYTDTYNELRGAARCLASRQGLATDETAVVGIVGNYGLIRSCRESTLNSITSIVVQCSIA